MNNKPLLVLVPELRAVPGVNRRGAVDQAWAELIAARQAEFWRTELHIAEEYVDTLEAAYVRRMVEKGEDPKWALRALLVEVEDARRETHWRALVKPVADKFHVSEEEAKALLAEAQTHFHKNARPVLARAIAPVYAKLQHASKAAFLKRTAARQARTPMAQAFAQARPISR